MGVGCLGQLLVSEFYPYLIDVETDIGLVLDGEVNEKIITDRIDVVQSHRHAVFPASHVAVFGRRVPYTPRKRRHISL